MNVLVSIKSGKQLSMSANFGMFVSCENDNRQYLSVVNCLSIFPTFLVSSLEQMNLKTNKHVYSQKVLICDIIMLIKEGIS